MLYLNAKCWWGTSAFRFKIKKKWKWGMLLLMPAVLPLVAGFRTHGLAVFLKEALASSARRRVGLTSARGYLTADGEIDVGQVRADMAPALAEGAIHLNSAGASPSPRPVLQAVVNHLELEARVGGYEAAARAAPRLAAVYASLARLLNCDPSEVALAESATAAWQRAVYAVAWRRGDVVFVGAAEYGANMVALLQLARARGIEVRRVPSDARGQIDVAGLDAMAAAAGPRARAVCLTHVPTNGGLVNPAAAVGAVARRRGLLYVLDACQSLGQMPVDVAALGADVACGTGRKFLRGPRGTGFLYVRRAAMLGQMGEPPTLDHFGAAWVADDAYRLRPDARRFEQWESGAAQRLGLGAAVDYALALGPHRIYRRARRLADLFREGLQEGARGGGGAGGRSRGRRRGVPGARCWDRGQERCAIVSFTLEGVPAADVAASLAQQGVFVSVTVPGTSTRLDAAERPELPAALVRASFHYFNTEGEVAWVLRRLRELAAAAAAGGGG